MMNDAELSPEKRIRCMRRNGLSSGDASRTSEVGMRHDFTDLIADLDSAKADLARAVKRQRKRADDHRRTTVTADEADSSVFGWADRSRS
jgi:hypothetical protein